MRGSFFYEDTEVVRDRAIFSILNSLNIKSQNRLKTETKTISFLFESQVFNYLFAESFCLL